MAGNAPQFAVRFDSGERYNRDHLCIRWTYLDDPDGPDYDLDGRLEVELGRTRIIHEFSALTEDLRAWYDQLRALHRGDVPEARVSGRGEDFTLILSAAATGAFPVRVDLDLLTPEFMTLQLGGFATESTALLEMLRRLRQFLSATDRSGS